MAEEIILKVGVEGTGEGETKIKSLKAQLKEMKNELLGLDEGSDRFKQLSKDAGELQDRIGDVNDKVKALASDTKRLDALVGVGSAIAGGFQAAQGAMALFGSDSKKVEEAIKNIIAVQGILNGVQQVGQFITAKGIVQDTVRNAITNLNIKSTQLAIATQKVWNYVMSINPAVLFATAVLGLIGAIKLFSKTAEVGTKAQEALNRSIEQGDKAAGEEESKIKILLASINDHTLSIRKKQQAIKELNAISPTYLGNLTLENINTKEATESINAYIESIRRKIELQAIEEELSAVISERIKLERTLQEDLNSTAQELTEEAIQHAKDEENALLSLISTRQLSNDTLSQEVNLRKTSNDFNLENKRKEIEGSRETARVEVETEEEKQKRLLEIDNRSRIAKAELDVESAQSFEEQKQAEIELLRLQHEIALQDTELTNNEILLLNEKLANDIGAINISIYEHNKALQEQSELDEQARIQREQERMDQEFEMLEAQIDRENELKAQQEELETQRIAARQKLTEDLAKASIDLAQTVFTITNALGKQDEESRLKRAKRQFEINKALSIADATISTINGVVNALSEKSILPAPLSTIARLSNAAAVAAAGIANIAKISAQKFDGGVASPVLGSGGDSSGGASTTPNITPIQAGSTFLNQEPQKVYVVESEITDTQNSVKATIAEATF